MDPSSASSGRDILVAIATYNEIQSVPNLVEEILRIRSDADILIVDDNSPDGTAKWCAQRAQLEPRLRFIVRPKRRGVGSAVREAIEFAVQSDYRLLVNMDGDLSHSPSVIGDLICALDVAAGEHPPDVAVATRYSAGGGVRNWPVHRWIMSRLVNSLTRILLGMRTTDCSGSFRAYRVSALAALPPNSVQSTGYAFFEEILWRLERGGARIVEVPYVFENRTVGKSKTGPLEALSAVSSLIRLFFLRVTGR